MKFLQIIKSHTDHTVYGLCTGSSKLNANANKQRVHKTGNDSRSCRRCASVLFTNIAQIIQTLTNFAFQLNFFKTETLVYVDSWT